MKRYEWQGTYPGIGKLLELLLNQPVYFSISEFANSQFVDDLWNEIGQTTEGQKDDIWQIIDDSIAATTLIEPLKCCQIAFARLHLIGAIGLKLATSSAWQWFHETGKTVPQHQIDLNTKIKIHPMLHFSLGNVVRR